ncbi:UbiA-like polyprenyltransferase [Seleniivibrio woodruffii]|uniref:4-hydroxybenzoate polyprenyltransferase n=1 Tax=Seleniivibrio woodruffii TaxID=1078050 RepID=A0A4R1K9E9_9BACT|nr:UbiA-like polyprenyltransferase [Seleniivibrio woodruffii]TCK60647.1 4-hydroxybenzoate polyprenyltransferase [Seleniivibrio woodruffii]TVZ36277.1 4-hydroxybenzoate polyprenyltransferase [Seleniivibrio woodruffii]
MEKLKTFLSMIKVEHTLFALPFAFTGMFLAADGLPDLRTVGLIALAVLGARSGAMGFNRIADAKIDARNPRTEKRDIPAGKISVVEASLYTVLSFALYFLAAYLLNPLCFYLSPVPFIVFILYSYTKRFTFLCHIVLGVALGIAPIGAWAAVTGDINLGISLLGLAVLFWVSGFDIVYACQDIEFDKSEGLFSIPRFLGLSRSLMLARLFHLTAFGLFFYTWHYFQMGFIYLAGILLSGGFMVYQHAIIKPSDLSRLGMAFFNLNAYISVTICIFTFVDIMVKRMI